MRFQIYKPGQGYWVRVLSAVGAGMLVLAAAAWLWSETKAIPVPIPTWSMTLTGVSGAPAAGSEVQLQAPHAETVGAWETIGRAKVKSFTPGPEGSGRGELVIGGASVDRRRSPAETRRVVQPAAGGGEAFAGAVDGAPVGKPLYEPVLLQGVVVGVVLLAGAAVTFWFVGSNPRTVEFLVLTDGEMRKVNWSTRREILGSTWVVITATFLLVGLLFVVDTAFVSFFRLIDVIQ